MTVGGELSLHDLVDLSLGTPEVVNYRGLRMLLLTIVDTLHIGDVKAQLKESEKREILAGKDGEINDMISRVASSTNSSEVVDLEKKVSQLETKLESFSQLPSNENLMHRVRSSEKSDHYTNSQAPVSEMWQLMQVQKKAQTNEEGVSKLMSMVEHLMGEFQDMKANVDGMEQQMEKCNSEISHLQEEMTSVNKSNSTVMERLNKVESASTNMDKMNELQKFMNNLNNKLSSLPPIELIVTWPAMEDTLKGVYKEPIEMLHHEMQTSSMTDTPQIQTMPTNHAYAQTMTPSPPGSQQSSRPSSAAHPSQEIQKILKNIGDLNGKHSLLDDRVTGLEELIAQKANMADVEKMIMDNAIPEDIQKIIIELKEGLEELRENREKLQNFQSIYEANGQSCPVTQNDFKELKAFVENHLKQVYNDTTEFSTGSCEVFDVTSESLQLDLENQVQQDLRTLSHQVMAKFASQLKELIDRMGSLEDLLNSKLNLIGKKLQKVDHLLQDASISSRQDSALSAAVEGTNSDRETPSPVNDVDDIAVIKSRLLNLQAEADKLNQTCIHMVDEHNAKQKHIDALYTIVDRLQENKADREHVTMEIDVKADKRALENKISRNQFEGTVEEISRNLNNVMEKLSGHQSAWQQAVGEIKVDVENKVDRIELDPLKSYLDKRIKAANAKLIRKEHDSPEDAAGFRKQLIHQFHCISCDRPLDLTPQAPLASLPESRGLPGTRSGRPYTSFELEQIRATQKRSRPGKSINHYERALFEQELARQRKQDIVAYLVHFDKTKKDLSMVQNCMSVGLPCLPANRNITISNQYHDVPDYYVTNRSCGGSHTLTYPHRRVTRITHLSNIVQSEDVTTPIANGKMETDVIGQDGHIYKARISPTNLPTLAPGQVQSARSKLRLGSARVRSQTAPFVMQDDPQAMLSSRPSSSRQHPSRPQSSRSLNARPQSGRHSRSPTNNTTQHVAGDGLPLTPNASQDGDGQEGQKPMMVVTPSPSEIDEITVELPGSSPQDTPQITT